MTFRWYGEGRDSISLKQIRQIPGMSGLMGVLDEKAAGEVWTEEEIKKYVDHIPVSYTHLIDDYFNCLTVGSVMRPVTDKHKVSRAKLAYLIDATAAPVCIIAPISSWAAACLLYTSRCV